MARRDHPECGRSRGGASSIAALARCGTRRRAVDDRRHCRVAQSDAGVADCDRRSRLPAAVAAVLRNAVLTPKGLAAELAIASQTATAILRELRTAKLVTEITGRRSFRAFAITPPG